MSIGLLIAVALRLAVPPVILRYPFAGLAACILLDTFDVTLADAIGGPASLARDPLVYHGADKVLDAYYLAFVYAVSLRWPDRAARGISTVLFWHRFTGVAIFIFTGWRPILLLFPNVFEYFVLLYLALGRFFPRLRPYHPWHFAVILLAAGLPQVVREWVYHVREMGIVDFLNAFTPLEIREPSIWDWLKSRF